jgi:predicted Rossmann fold nucleotide-binding protein DprA/Smf involved in DNA uptake
MAHIHAGALGIIRVIHPPDNPRYRAYCHKFDGMSTVVRPEEPYLQRNAAIIAGSDYLIAVPDRPEHARSGTWATVRLARREQKMIFIIRPGGTIEVDGWADGC